MQNKKTLICRKKRPLFVEKKTLIKQGSNKTRVDWKIWVLRSVKGEAGESEHPTDDEALFEGDSGGVAMVDIGNDFVDDDDIHFEIIFQ